MQRASVDDAVMDNSLSGPGHDLMPLPPAVASSPRRLEPVERRSSNVITPPYSVDQWTVSQLIHIIVECMLL